MSDEQKKNGDDQIEVQSLAESIHDTLFPKPAPENTVPNSKQFRKTSSSRKSFLPGKDFKKNQSQVVLKLKNGRKAIALRVITLSLLSFLAFTLGYLTHYDFYTLPQFTKKLSYGPLYKPYKDINILSYKLQTQMLSPKKQMVLLDFSFINQSKPIKQTKFKLLNFDEKGNFVSKRSFSCCDDVIETNTRVVTSKKLIYDSEEVISQYSLQIED